MSTLFVSLQGLIVSAHCSEQIPAVVCQKSSVIDTNDAAKQCKIRPGMDIREARAFSAELKVFEYCAELANSKMNEWLDIATLYTDEIEYTSPSQAYLDLSAHPRPIEIAKLFLDHLERRFPYTYQAAISPTKWVSNVLSRFPIRNVVIAGMELAPEPIYVLAPIEPVKREKLIFLGYKRVRDVQSLPVETLKSQFGQDAYRILSAANGGLHEPVQTNYPAKRISESISFIGGVSNLEVIHEAICDISKRLIQVLCNKAFTAKNIHILIGLEDETKEVNATFAKPFRGALGLQTALLKLFHEQEIQVPIERLTIVLPSLSKANPKQRDLAGLPTGDTSFAEDAFESVRHKFGTYSVHPGVEHQVPRRILVLRAWSKSTGWSG